MRTWAHAMIGQGWEPVAAGAVYLVSILFIAWGVTAAGAARFLLGLGLLAIALGIWFAVADSWWRGEVMALVLLFLGSVLIVVITRPSNS